MNLNSELIQTVIQIITFTLIPFIVYVIKYRRKYSFLNFLGFTNSNGLINLYALMIGVIISCFWMFLFSMPAFKILVLDPMTVTGKIHLIENKMDKVFLIFIISIFKTALSEEILFRGFIAKRLISKIGYKYGNIVQSLIFAIIHVLIFLLITKSILFLTVSFFVPFVMSYVMCYINEVKNNGSIISSWIIHSISNIISYTYISFYL
jgi:uncharacterized protein